MEGVSTIELKWLVLPVTLEPAAHKPTWQNTYMTFVDLPQDKMCASSALSILYELIRLPSSILWMVS